MTTPRNAAAPVSDHVAVDLTTPGQRTVVGRAAPGMATRLLRAISGTTGAYRASRRGSFLVLVVGTLALMSVFAVVYISIGRADTGAAVGVQRNAARDNVPQQVADYIGGVLSDDLFSRSFAGDEPQPNTSTDQLIRRETWDTAGMSPTDTIATFTPYGNGTDPFLSLTVPVTLDFATTSDEFTQYTDLLNISALAPDGAPVNLHNLRGNFEATSQTMRQGLSFLTKNGASTTSTDYGEAVPAYSPASKPWFYWTRQRGMFRPTTFTGGTPDTATYAPYQYASTQGSGMYDARWFELVEARTTNAADNKNLLEAPSKYRYFIAGSVMDLGAFVNISTAGDFRAAPVEQAPVGLTPADIDARRLLALEDFVNQVSGKPGSWKQVTDPTPGGYVQPTDLVPPPANADKQPYFYGKYNNSGTTGGANLVGSWAYTALQKALTEGYVPKSGAVTQGGTLPFTYGSSVERSDFYTGFAGFDSSVVRDGSAYRVGALFSADDLLDLFAYRAWNNPDIDSTLERIVGGRYDATGSVNTKAFSVLRDNRPQSVERDAIDLNPPFGAADPKAQLALYANPRLYLTTISGARPLRSTIIGALTPGVADQLTEAELKVSADAGPEKTFRVYADALIPHSDQVGTWFGETQHNNYRTQNYGHVTAELGLQMAANMAVNLDQMLEWDNQPRAFTVLVDEDFRTELEKDWAGTGPATGKLPKRIAQRTYKNSWWVEKSDTTGQLDLGQPGWLTNPTLKDKSRLAHDGSSQPMAGAFTVFGVSPEPVLTSVVTMNVYTDAPTAATDFGAGGDVDGKGDQDNGDPGDKVTIDGPVRANNPDFLFQVVAFQLTNPYETSINLNSTVAANDTTSAPYDYYFEFGQRYYRVGQLNRDDPAAPIINVTLGPGVTRVFFATNVSLETAAARVRNAFRNPSTGQYSATLDECKTYVRNWIDKQLAVTSKSGDPAWAPVWIEPFSTTLNTAGGPALNALKNSQRNAYTNATFYDILEAADKTADPASVLAVKTTRLWRALRSTKGPTRTDTGELADQPVDPMPEQFLENDMLVDRLRDHFTANTKPSLDSRLPGGNPTIPSTVGFDESASFQGDNSGFSLVRYGVVRRPADPQGGAIPVGAMPAYMLEAKYFRTLNTLSPDYRRGGGGATPLNQDFFTTDNGEDIKVQDNNYAADVTLKRMFDRQGGSGFGGVRRVLPYDPLGTEPSKWTVNPIQRVYLASAADLRGSRPSLPTQVPKDQFRIGDALLPHALGPMQYIFDPANPIAPKTTDVGYLDAQWMTTSEMLALSTGYDWLRSTGAGAANKVFVPLYSEFGPLIAAGGTVPGKTDRAQLTLDDYVPFYDVGGVAPPARPIFDPVAGDYRRGMGIPAALAVLDGFISPELSKFGSLSRSIPGLVNVGTAPAPVLRTLPLVSPTTEAGAWWWTGSALGVGSDIGASIAGYRDKVEVPFRAGSATVGGPGAAPTTDYLDSTGIKPSDLQRLDGRNRANGIEGVRELPGIRSIGEIGVARNTYNPTDPNEPIYTKLNSIDFAGYITGNEHRVGVDSQLYDGTKVSTVANSYSEKLAVLTAVSNTVTNRSDLFAVWFVVNGYQRSDVENLNATDPMIPSVQRRFFMVVDRSEVVKQGQKPRIVLMRELPM